MSALYARSVFFVNDAEKALEFYTKKLGGSLDWQHEHDGRPHVFQVNLLGFELIINQCETDTKDRPGHGRIFIGLNEAQTGAFKTYITDKAIPTMTTHWGAPTVVINDLDKNELFFWLAEPARN